MQSTLFDHDTPSGKTSQEFCQRQTMLSAACWEDLSVLMRPSKLMTRGEGEPDQKAATSPGRVRVWLMDPSEQQRGASWMPNISAWPNAASVCSLSSVLEPPESIPRKYFLSGTACAGILRRAEKRGKELPEALRLALAEVVGLGQTSIATAGLLPASNSAIREAAEMSDGEMSASHLEHCKAEPPPESLSESLQSPCASTGGAMNRIDAETETLITHALRGEGFDASEDGTGRGTPLVPVANSLNGNSGRMQIEATYLPILEVGARTGVSTTDIRAGSGIGNDGDPMFTLQSGKQHGVLSFHENQRGEISMNDTVGSLKVGGGKPGQGYPAVAFNLRGREGGAMPEPTDVASLRSASGGSSRTYVGVRRLMPVECERLQGMADSYTAVEYNGKPAKDGPRYRAIGNSMAVPVLSWILRRIN